MTGKQIEHAITGFLNPDSGVPLAGGTIEIIKNDGTTDYETVYSDLNLTVEITQPITLNDAGQPTVDGTNPVRIYLDSLVKIRYKDSDGAVKVFTDAIDYSSGTTEGALSYIVDISEQYGTSDANINQAIIDFGSSNVVFLWKDSFTISTNKNFASNIYNLIAGDGKITISPEVTVTLSGDMEDNGGQGIVCNGTLTFADSTLNIGKAKEYFSGTGVINGNIANSTVSEDWFASSGIYSTLTYDNNSNIYAKEIDAVNAVKVSGNNISPVGQIIEFGGSSIPDGFLPCDGKQYSRTTYSDLFTVIGTIHGEGDGSTTFNVPDRRWVTPRGYGVDISVTGTGSAVTNNATFTDHEFNRTGVKCRLSSGTLTGLSVDTDYYVIYIDNDTLAFATSKANSFAGTKIAISGVNSAVIIQYMDPDASTREAVTTGGSTGEDLGSYQEDELKLHDHGFASASSISGGGSNPTVNGGGNIRTGATGGNETRGKNVYVNYCIRY